MRSGNRRQLDGGQRQQDSSQRQQNCNRRQLKVKRRQHNSNQRQQLSNRRQHAGNRRKGLSFLDLPPEVRSVIYRLLLAEPTAVHIAIRKRNSLYDWAMQRLPLKDISILFTNRQINVEACQVLYGANAFSFYSTTALKEWLDQIGPHCVQFLRDVHIQRSRDVYSGWMASTANAALKRLSPATNLRNLSFDHANCCNALRATRVRLHATRERPRVTRKPVAYGIVSAEQLVESCKPLLLALHKSFSAQRLDIDVRDVLRLRAFGVTSPLCGSCAQTQGSYEEMAWRKLTRSCGNYWRGVCTCRCNEREASAAEFGSEIRTLVGKLLDIEDEVDARAD